jgi:hypothetical protein
VPSHLSDPETLTIQTSDLQAGGHNHDTVVSNSPCLHGAQFYNLKENRTSMETTITNDSLRSSSDDANRHTASMQTSHSRSSGFVSGVNSRYVSSAAGSTHPETPKVLEETDSASDIEIGSLHSSSSVDSEELRLFYNHMWNAGPFIASGP